jgi:tripartite-type tricarboxylate transporter receptor subunit TctC
LLLLNMPFDAQRDLRPVSGVYTSVNFLVVPATLQVNNIGELVEYSKKKAGGVNFASYGAVTEIMAAVLMRETGMKGTSIGYKGAVPALLDLLAGRIDMLYTSLALIEGPLDERKLRAVAVTGNERFDGRPDVPTFLEQGVSLKDSLGWWGLFARSGTPDPLIKALHAEFTKTLQEEEIRRAMIQGGSIPIPMNSPEEFTAWINADRSKTERLVRSIGMPRQ